MLLNLVLNIATIVRIRTAAVTTSGRRTNFIYVVVIFTVRRCFLYFHCSFDHITTATTAVYKDITVFSMTLLKINSGR